jgi:hypothetical protein
MKSPSFTAGQIEATEQIVALIYQRYLYHRTFHGADSDLALSHKLLIHSIRDLQAETYTEEENE